MKLLYFHGNVPTTLHVTSDETTQMNDFSLVFWHVNPYSLAPLELVNICSINGVLSYDYSLSVYVKRVVFLPFLVL
jgi:hypothetical protein